MKRITPNTPSASEAISTAATGGRKVYKPELLIHAARNDLSMARGYTPWEAYKSVESAKAEKFMQDLCNGRIK